MIATRFSVPRIMVTGGARFLGGRSVAMLRERRIAEILVARSRDYDLRTKEGVDRALAAGLPELVIQPAAAVGGIGANQEMPEHDLEAAWLPTRVTFEGNAT